MDRLYLYIYIYGKERIVYKILVGNHEGKRPGFE